MGNVSILAMFGLGLGELAVIFIVILVVFGPKKLPELARAAGRAYREFSRTFHDIEDSLNTPPDIPTNPRSSLREENK